MKVNIFWFAKNHPCKLRQGNNSDKPNLSTIHKSCPFQKAKTLTNNKVTTHKHPKSFPKRKLLGCLSKINVWFLEISAALKMRFLPRPHNNY